MNGAFLMAQANQFMGNNIMNPQQQQRWMEKPPGDPSGLAYLRPLDSLLAKQVVSLTESKRSSHCPHSTFSILFSVMIGIPSQAKYGVFNDKGEQVYYAFEGDDSSQRVPRLKKNILSFRIGHLPTDLLSEDASIRPAHR